MADFIQGDYQYTIIDDEVWVQVVDTTKSSYEPLNSTVVYNNVTYTVTSMKNCFDGCTNFNQPIIIPNSVTNMSYCFKECTSFNQPITIPNSVTSMYYCFSGCSNFNQPITIPNSVTNMGYCFSGCSNFNQSIIISNSVTDMSYCFRGCTNFNQSIIIPDSVINMSYCFRECTSFNQPITIPNSVTNMRFCFYGCTSFNQPIIIPNSVTNISYCFDGCSNFNQSIIISNSVTDMSYCFYSCSSFNQPIIIPNSVTSMYYCFGYCINFNQSITIPNSVTDMTSCFGNCTSLAEYIFVNNAPTQTSIFRNTTENIKIFVINNNNSNGYSAWQNIASQYSNVSIGTLSDITTSHSFILGDYIYKRQNNSDVNLSISVIDRSKQSYGSILNTIYFNSNDFSMIVTDMSYCFMNCTSFNQSITIPNFVEDMSYCFMNCTSFNQSIIIPNSVEDMSYCFKNCTALSNNIIVIGYRSNNDGLFTGTNKPIYICLGLGGGSESAANGWRQVAAQYPNVHFEADDHPAPNLTLTATRGTGTGENWVSSADGDSIKLEATWSINTELLPYGYEVTRNNPQVFLDNNSSGDEFTTNIIYKTLSTEPLNQHTFTAQLSDGYKTATVTAIVTRVGALLDFLGNQNPTSPYVDKPGTGMAIGTFAIRSGLDIQFPTTIGNGLIPPTQPIFSENPSISTDTNIQLDKNYYVLGGEKYYKVNIIKGTTEENNETVEKPFILTKDSSPVSGKTYYETNDKITFEIPTSLPNGSNPVNEGWYEEDTRSPYDNNWYAATQEAIDLNNFQLTIGDYNLQDPGIQSEYGDVALIIGNGTNNANRSNAVTIGKDGLVGAYINYDTDTPGIDPETGQYFTRFAIINSNNNKVTYMDAHKWSGDRTLGVFGAQRKFEDSPDPIQNQFGLGIDGDKSLYVWIPDNAQEAWNKALNADHVTSRGTSGIWTYRKWRSGDAECWGLIASKSYVMTSGPWGTGYYSQGNTVNFPSGLFTSTPTVSLNKCSSGNGLEWISIYGVTTSGVTYYACDTKSGTISFAIAAYARGRWK